MKKCLVIGGLLILWFVFAPQAAQAQNVSGSQVCISPEAARKALQDSDTVAAQVIELKAKDQAIEDLRKELNAMRIELAKAIGEKTGSEQMVVRMTAIIDFMLKNGREKCYGLICIQ